MKNDQVKFMEYIIYSIIEELKLNFFWIGFQIPFSKESVTNHLKQTGYLFLCNDQIYLYFVLPHKGNNFSYLVRADFKETFNRCSVYLFERFIKDEKDVKNLIIDLKKFYENKSKIILEELEK